MKFGDFPGAETLRNMSHEEWLRLDPFRGFDASLRTIIGSALTTGTPEYVSLIDKLVNNPSKSVHTTGQVYVIDGQHPQAFTLACGLIAHLKRACAAPSRSDARALAELYSDYTKEVAGYPIKDLIKSELDLLVISNLDSFEKDRLKDKVATIISSRLGTGNITILEASNADITLDEFRFLKTSFNERLVTVWPKR